VEQNRASGSWALGEFLVNLRTRMRQIPALIIVLGLLASVAEAQAPSQSAASKDNLLSMDQKIKIAQLITKRTPPLPSGSFSITMDGIVPAGIQLHSLPAEAERLAPQLRGFGYIVIEEQIAFVDQRTRKVELVVPRWGE
jgi:hypothetical protein